MAFTPEQIAALYAPFRLEEHSIREGNRAKSGKIQWFVYVERAAVQRRLDEVFPGDWEFHHISTVTHEAYVTVTAGLIIDGKRRDSNGGQSIKFENDEIDEDHEKGAMTECFRRCASLWGIGLYLYEMDYPIWTEGYEKGKYQDMEARKKEALDKFRAWYQRMFKSNVVELEPAPAHVAGMSDGEAAAALLNGNGQKTERSLTAPAKSWSADEPGALDRLIDRAEMKSGAVHTEVVNTVWKMNEEGKFAGKAAHEALALVLARLASHEKPAKPKNQNEQDKPLMQRHEPDVLRKEFYGGSQADELSDDWDNIDF